jgi:aminotransferase EvaB
VCARGINSRLDELQAALLAERLKVVDYQNNQRVEIMRRYDDELSFLNPVPKKPGRVPHLYVVRPHKRETFRKFLLKNNIQTGVHYPLALTRHAFLMKNSFSDGCPVAENASRHVVSLPCFPGMMNDEVEKVIYVCQQWKNSHA